MTARSSNYFRKMLKQIQRESLKKNMDIYLPCNAFDYGSLHYF